MVERWDNQIDESTIRVKRVVMNNRYVMGMHVFAEGRDGVTRYKQERSGATLISDMLFEAGPEYVSDFLSNEELSLVASRQLAVPAEKIRKILMMAEDFAPDDEWIKNIALGPYVEFDKETGAYQISNMDVGLWEKVESEGENAWVELTEELAHEIEERDAKEWDGGNGRVVVGAWQRDSFVLGDKEHVVTPGVANAVMRARDVEYELRQKINNGIGTSGEILEKSFEYGEDGERWRTAELEYSFLRGTEAALDLSFEDGMVKMGSRPFGVAVILEAERKANSKRV